MRWQALVERAATGEILVLVPTRDLSPGDYELVLFADSPASVDPAGEPDFVFELRILGPGVS